MDLKHLKKNISTKVVLNCPPDKVSDLQQCPLNRQKVKVGDGKESYVPLQLKVIALSMFGSIVKVTLMTPDFLQYFKKNPKKK